MGWPDGYKSFIVTRIHALPEGRPAIDCINSKADEMRASLSDSTNDFKMVEVKNNNPFSQGVFMRAKGKDKEGALQDKLKYFPCPDQS
ncbi:MAG: hypothetical protein WCG61_06030 [Chlorobium sp.]